MPYIPSTTVISNSGVFFSYIMSDGEVVLDLLTEDNLYTSTTPTRLPDVGHTHDVLKDTVVKKTNYNPNNATDRYGTKTKAKRHIKFGHTLNDGATVDNAIFNISLNEAFGSMVVNTYQWHNKPVTNDYTVGAFQFIYYNDINNEAWGKISKDVKYQCLPIGSGYLHSILQDSYHNIDTTDYCVYDNYDVNMGHNGSVIVTEDVKNKTVTLTAGSTGRLNTLDSLGIGAVESELYDDTTGNLIITKKDMSYSYGTTSYTVTFPWNDKKYKDITGASISENWTLDSHMHTMLVSKYTGHPFNILSLEANTVFTHPTITGYFYYSDEDTMLSGYYSVPSMYIKTPDDSTLTKMQLHYNDGSANEQYIDVKNLEETDFEGPYSYLLGKSCHIRSYFDTIADDFYNISSSVVPIHNAYFDVEDLTLTMSGTRTDPVDGNIAYSSNFLAETDGIISENKLHSKFRSVGEVKIDVTLSVKGNVTDFNDVTRTVNPYPRDIWLIAVPIEGLDNATLKEVFLKINEDAIIAERNKPDELTKFPKIQSATAKSMSELCTGTAHTATAEGIIWNKQTPGNPEIPEDGTFTEDEYTIDVTIPQGSWAPFIVIGDMGPAGYSNFTGYCLSNIANYETPHPNSFEY